MHRSYIPNEGSGLAWMSPAQGWRRQEKSRTYSLCCLPSSLSWVFPSLLLALGASDLNSVPGTDHLKPKRTVWDLNFHCLHLKQCLKATSYLSQLALGISEISIPLNLEKWTFINDASRGLNPDPGSPGALRKDLLMSILWYLITFNFLFWNSFANDVQDPALQLYLYWSPEIR